MQRSYLETGLDGLETILRLLGREFNDHFRLLWWDLLSHNLPGGNLAKFKWNQSPSTNLERKRPTLNFSSDPDIEKNIPRHK